MVLTGLLATETLPQASCGGTCLLLEERPPSFSLQVSQHVSFAELTLHSLAADASRIDGFCFVLFCFTFQPLQEEESQSM